MPFQKGNKLWEKGIDTKKEKQAKIDAFLMAIADGGIEKYATMMGELAEGEDIAKPKKEYMDRLEGWAEYVRPKLSRAEMTGKGGKELVLNVVNYADSKELQSKKLPDPADGGDR